MTQQKIKIVLKHGKDDSPKRFHPWIFSGAIKSIEGSGTEGAVADVYDAKGQFLATGIFSTGSIAVRILSFLPTELDASFWEQKIKEAWMLRKECGLAGSLSTNVFRLIYGEGDGLPGLIIDYYNGVAVFQAHSFGIYCFKEKIIAAMQHVLGDQLVAVYDKSAETLPGQYAQSVKNGYLYGTSGEAVVLENGYRFSVDWVHGQKTGFFIDQRDNRQLLMRYCKGKKVLNTFCYSGGFSVYAAMAGASEVYSVDSSAKAIELTDRNVKLNEIQNHQSFVSDTFDFLKGKQNEFDVVILDPPAFAKHRDAKHNAVMGYKRLNCEAIKLIKPNGILFTFSCSQVVNKGLFYNTIMAAAIESGRNVKVLHQLGHPADHPVNIYHPEGEYLKGLVLYII